MTFKVTLVGAQAHESTPEIALYAIDPKGRPRAKIAAVENGRLAVPERRTGTVAFGPNVHDAASLDPKGLVTLRLADQLPIWERNNEILIPAQWWRGWLGFTICVSGTVQRCFPFVLDTPAFRAIALGQRPGTIREFCSPLCNGVVEVWTSTTCCWPLPLVEVPNIIAKLAQFLADNPIMFPTPRPPGPGPVERELANRVDRALGAGKVDTRFVPSTELAHHLETLRSLSAADAVSYIEANPILWWFWCHTSVALIGETPLNPDGSFSFCYWHWPFFLLNCRTSYFYKVRQLVNGVWTYVYDGSVAHQYFTADEVANLATMTGVTCAPQSPIPTGSVTIEAIGTTNAWDIDSAWNGADGAGNDLTQTATAGGVAAMPIPGGPQNAGLKLANGAPWIGDLYVSLNFDPAMEGLGAAYYRLSTVQADLGGNPIGTPWPVQTVISWNWLDVSVFPPVTRTEQLGPTTPAGSPNGGLYAIPYESDKDWLGLANGPAGMFHMMVPTASLPNAISGGPGMGNGRYMLILEIFNASGQRLVPTSATPAAGDVPTAFSFVRLLGPPSGAMPGPVSVVPQTSLATMLWTDNRPVVGDIGYFQSSAGTQECQFIKATPDTYFQVGYYAYHAVMCDASVSPVPPATFMDSYSVTYEEGLGGHSGTLDVNPVPIVSNNPAVCPPGSAFAVTPANASSTFAALLNGETACAFSIGLTVRGKHTDGFSQVSPLTWTAAVALSV